MKRRVNELEKENEELKRKNGQAPSSPVKSNINQQSNLNNFDGDGVDQHDQASSQNRNNQSKIKR